MLLVSAGGVIPVWGGETGLEHAAVVHGIQRSVRREHEAGILHVLVRVHTGTAKVKTWGWQNTFKK